MNISKQLPRPERLRVIERPFAWIPCRVLSQGYLAEMSSDAGLLYLFLALAADRRGVSFYGDKRIADTLALPQLELERARQELLERDLIAYDGRIYQLLTLPNRKKVVAPKNGTTPNQTKPISPQPDRVRRESLPTLQPESVPQAIPEEARKILRTVFGPNSF